MRAELFFAEPVPWPDTPDGEYARNFLAPLLREGCAHFVANAPTKLGVVLAGERVLPFTVGCEPGGTETSYVCSPVAHYADYAREEIALVRMPRLAAAPLRGGFRRLGDWLRRAELDRTVLVNNWLLSTNLYPALTREETQAIVERIREVFPEHAIAFRSVDEFASAPLLSFLQDAGGMPVFARRVWYQDARGGRLRARRQVRLDLRHASRSTLRLVDGRELEQDCAAELRERYEQLYLAKYSRRNPQFTEAFFRAALRDALLTLRALVNDAEDGRIEGVLGYFSRRNADGKSIMTQPVFGYDTARPVEWALYRRLSLETILEGERSGHIVHASAGAGGFKAVRGAVGVSEWLVVFHGHLPARRRRPWNFLRALSTRIAEPLIRRFQW